MQNIQERFNKFFLQSITEGYRVFVVDVDGDLLWKEYLASFPTPAQRQFHRCNTCQSFIRNYGNIVLLNSELDIRSIWDFNISPLDEMYQAVVALRTLVKVRAIVAPFYTKLRKLGTTSNVDTRKDKPLRTWYHWALEVPSTVYVSDPNKLVSLQQGSYITLDKALSTIKPETVNTVLDFIEEGGIIARGEQFKQVLTDFGKLLEAYTNTNKKNAFVWSLIDTPIWRMNFSNTAIATLLYDLQKPKFTLEEAVDRYNSLMGGYKVAKAIVTSSMIEEAKQVIKERGYDTLFTRRVANIGELPPQYLLADYGDDKLASALDVLDDIKQDIVDKADYSRVPTLERRDFVDKLKRARSVQVLFTPSISKNLMVMVTGDHCDAFIHRNPYTWHYIGGKAVSDEFNQRVTKKGGNVLASLQASLMWYNTDDLDLYGTFTFTAGKPQLVFFNNKWLRDKNTRLDVDANAGDPLITDPVENIYCDAHEAPTRVLFYVRNYHRRNYSDVGFAFKLRILDEVFYYNYDHNMMTKKVEVVALTLNKDYSIKSIEHKLPYTTYDSSGVTVWGLKQHTWIPITKVVPSPNTWEGSVGNPHLFLLTDKISVPEDEKVYPFFNELLVPGVLHKRVYQALANKCNVAGSKHPASGFGLSDLLKTPMTIKIDGRVYNVK